MTRQRLAVICDYSEEAWTSMDLCAQMLLKHLQLDHTATIEAQQICPSFRRRLSQVPRLGQKRLAFNADRLLNRFWDYPSYLHRQVAAFDWFHVCDHTYAQLIHVLPPERTGVFCHDLDAFRSLVEPDQDLRPTWYKAMSHRILTGLQKAAVVFYSTAEVRRQIEYYGLVDSSRLVPAPYGTAQEFSAIPKDINSTDYSIIKQVADAPFLLHVGSCIPRKRIDVLLEVFATVKQAHPNLHLVKVGGEWTTHQRSQITRLNLDSSIVHLQNLERSTIACLYRQAAIVMLTSDAEGFGLPIVEAFACGATVVSSDIPVLREVGGAAGIYCPVGDVVAWAATIEHRLATPITANEQQQRRAQAAKYSWSTHAQTIAQTYLRLANHSSY